MRSGEDKSFVLWLTGLPGAGKTTLADRVYDCIAMNGQRAEKLDGDMVRSLFPSTGFGKVDRDAHIKRVGFLASSCIGCFRSWESGFLGSDARTERRP